MLRGLIYHWRLNLAVAAGAAVATAVLAGAVILGDSMEESLRRLTIDRLGDIDWALVTEGTVRADLADDLAAALATGSNDDQEPRIAPLLAATASAVHTESRALASGVRLFGIDARFAALFPSHEQALLTGMERRSGQIFPSVAINRSLAREIGIQVGQDLLLSFEQVSEIPRESLLGSRPPDGTLAALRATVSAILPDSGPGRFALASHQEQSLNAFVDLEVLQSRIDQWGRVNTLLAAGNAPDDEGEALQAALNRLVTFDDLGLDLERQGDLLAISNRRFALRDSTFAAIDRVARRRSLTRQDVLGYLANRIVFGEHSIPYSVVIGLDLPSPESLGRLSDIHGEALRDLPDDQIVLGQWAADELGAEAGSVIELIYYGVGNDDALETRSVKLTVAGIAAMSGLMTDRNLLPDFPGIAEADDIAAWEPPFPMDLGLIQPRDEEFWDLYGPAPKAIVNLATAQRLWANRFGRVTAVRIAVAAAEQEAVVQAVREELDLESFRISFEPVKRQGLAASTGATDFAGLFLSFSLFLIVAAGLVVGLLFSLSVESKASEIGLRRALGFPLASVRRRLLAEGLLLAAIGGVAGIALAIAYAALLIRVIARLWADMLDLPLLTLEVDVTNVTAATAGAILLVALTVILTVRRLRLVPIPALLAGATRVEPRRQGGRWARLIAALALGAGALAVATALATGSGASPALFFAAGALFLTGGLASFAAWLRGRPHELSAGASAPWVTMAARNSGFNPGRSLLSVALVACASFMLVSVAANRRVLRPEALGRDSGTGGFSLVARTSVPVRGSLADPATHSELGLSDEGASRLAANTAYSLRLLPGDDASCLNLYQPKSPRVIGAPDDLIARGGFAFSSMIETRDNPWTLLQDDYGDGVIPAIGDANSVTWILHSGLGKEITLTDDRGEPVRLLLVGLLSKSIFQSELVVSESAFLKHFPHHGGYSYFLLQTEADEVDTTAAALESELSAYGFDATTTVDQLGRFLGIEEMYLSTFQLLGGLGLILGTFGLGIVLIKNVNERRGELAMLRAVGFRQRSIAKLILLETAFQLTCGLVIGTLSGFLALVPYFLDTSLHLPWTSLLATMATVILVGMISAALGALAAMRTPLLPALKAD